MGTWLGNKAEALGGVILLLIGLKMGLGIIF
jgi:putative Mn2+ efflux pump MntP